MCIGRNICKGVRMASKHWRKSNVDDVTKYPNLEADIMNAPLHYLGVHDNCAEYFCKKTTDPEALSTISVLKETNLFYEIMDLCQHYFANNAKSLIAGYSTNKTEGFNSLIYKELGNFVLVRYKYFRTISHVQFWWVQFQKENQLPEKFSCGAV